jgi:hypothetical protein
VTTIGIIGADDVGSHIARAAGTPAKTFVGVEPTGASFEVAEYAVYQAINRRFKHMAAIHDADAVSRNARIL